MLGALLLCVLGWRVRKRDLGHLQWIEKRGVVRGRTELDASEKTREVPSKMSNRETEVVDVGAGAGAAALASSGGDEDESPVVTSSGMVRDGERDEEENVSPVTVPEIRIRPATNTDIPDVPYNAPPHYEPAHEAQHEENERQEYRYADQEIPASPSRADSWGYEPDIPHSGIVDDYEVEDENERIPASDEARRRMGWI